MPVFRWGDAWSAFGDIEEQIDRLLQGVNLSFQGLRLGVQTPPVNMYELDDEFLLTAEVPGTRPEELEVTYSAGVLTMKGRRQGEGDVAEEKFRRRERPRGDWQRSLTLPSRVDGDKLQAEFRNGVLKIHLPKIAEPPVRQIPVISGDS